MRLLFIFLIAFFSQCLVAQNPDNIGLNRVNPGPEVNTVGQEYAPVISADGSMLLFTSRKIEKEIKGKKPILSKETVYMSMFDSVSGKWTQAIPLDKQINQPDRHNSAIALSNDGQKMLLYRDDESGNGDIYESVLNGITWSIPKSLGKPVCSKYHESSASIAPDGRMIYFVSDRPGGIGGRDIWFCTTGEDGKYLDAINAGKGVNSPYEEEGVFIHPDGRTLYFSSNKPGGYGGFDLYRSERVDGKWSTPVNLGPAMNTSGDEMYFVSEASGKRSFISSAGMGSLGMQDIFIINWENKKDSTIKAPSLCLLKGTIVDANGMVHLEAGMEIIDNSTGKTVAEIKSNSSSGKYLVSLPSGTDYGIRVSAPGYLFYSENINIPKASGYKEVIHHIELNKLEAGRKVILKNIFYAFNKAELSPESKSELDHLIKLLNENPKIRVEIASHTDDVGSDEYNLRLSLGRAESVVKYLAEQGISLSRLIAKGYGESEPLVPNDSPEHQAMNRRTEFVILSN